MEENKPQTETEFKDQVRADFARLFPKIGELPDRELALATEWAGRLGTIGTRMGAEGLADMAGRLLTGCFAEIRRRGFDDPLEFAAEVHLRHQNRNVTMN